MTAPKNYDGLAKEVYEMLNRARTDPAWVAKELQTYKNYYKGLEYKNPALGFIFETQEGVKAVEDAIDFLKNKVYPQKPIGLNPQITRAAKALLEHFDQTGSTTALTPEM